MLSIARDVFNQIKEGLAEMPAPIKKFAIRALILFIVWQFVYLVFLLPARVVDRPLTNLVAGTTAKGLKILYPTKEFYTKEIINTEWRDVYITNYKTVVMVGKQKLIGIGDGCNGFSMCILYLGFILIFNQPVSKKIKYSIMGVGLIFCINILRCIGLGIIQIHWPHFTIYAHHYIFNIIIYITIIVLWFRFLKKDL